MPPDFLKEWLARSGSLNLQVDLLFRGTFRDKTSIRAKGHIDIIVAHIARWGTLAWQGYMQIFEEHIYSNLPQARALRELQLWAELSRRRGRYPQTLNGVVPHLRRLRLENLDQSCHPLLGGSSVTQLSLLQCGLTAEYFNLLLQAMPNICELHLENLRLSLSSKDISEIGHKPFRNLTHIVFNPLLLSLHDAMLFLHIIRATVNSLEHLSVRVTQFDHPDPLDGEDLSLQSLTHISEAFDILPSALKSLKIAICSDAILEENIRVTQGKLRARVQEMSKLESLELDFNFQWR
jgi:hypothetical protein